MQVTQKVNMKGESTGITAIPEARILEYLVGRVPRRITPDMLTAIALLSAIAGGFFYVAAGQTPLFLLGVNLCLVIHWLADSLDGKVARFRNIPRPNYGHYADHLLDSLSVILLAAGLTISSLTNTGAWIVVGALMLLAMVHFFLKGQATGKFELSIGLLGATETRIGLFLLNLLVLVFGNTSLTLFFLGSHFYIFDVIGWLGALIFVAVLTPEIIKTLRLLNTQDRKNI